MVLGLLQAERLHALRADGCRAVDDPLGTGRIERSAIGCKKSKEAWNQTYRALEHSGAKKACGSNKVALFPKEIQDFANLFVAMQTRRHSADYDPHEKFYKSAVSVDISQVEAVIADFGNASVKDRRAFTALVLLRPPRP